MDSARLARGVCRSEAIRKNRRPCRSGPRTACKTKGTRSSAAAPLAAESGSGCVAEPQVQALYLRQPARRAHSSVCTTRFGRESWPAGQGVTGEAWRRGEYVLARGEAAWDNTYGLTEAQQSRYRHLQVIAAMPVRDDSQHMLGVLTVSSRRDDGRLASPDGYDRHSELAQDLRSHPYGHRGDSTVTGTEERPDGFNEGRDDQALERALRRDWLALERVHESQMSSRRKATIRASGGPWADSEGETGDHGFVAGIEREVGKRHRPPRRPV
jgi:hypothetical protein